MAGILRNRLVCHFDGAATGQAYLLRIASSCRGQALNVLVACFEFFRGDAHEIGEPSIAVLCCTPLGGDAFATNPDGDARLLDGLGKEGQVLEGIELALEAALLLAPQTREDL